VIQRLWTQAEYRRLPEGPPYYELEDGKLIEMVRPRGRHQLLLGRLFSVLDSHLATERLGAIYPEVAVYLTPRHVYIPDLSFLLTEHLDRFADDIAIQGPPDLVVEVMSPSTASRDKAQKFRAYHKAGVPWYWLVETESLLVTEFHHTPDGYLVSQIVPPDDVFSPTLFPGLSLRLAELAGVAADEPADDAGRDA
jgi:Uma2 family endonuclease